MAKFDWSKESTDNRNFCGYCDNTPTSGSCNGNCFTRTDFKPKDRKQYKLTHLEDEITKNEERLIMLREELKRLT